MKRTSAGNFFRIRNASSAIILLLGGTVVYQQYNYYSRNRCETGDFDRDASGSGSAADSPAQLAAILLDNSVKGAPRGILAPLVKSCASHFLSRERAWNARVERRYTAYEDPSKYLNPVPEPYREDPEAWKARQAYDLFEPEWNCPLEQRVGVPYGDGGKWACSWPQPSPCLVYSVGSNYDFSFEAAVHQANPNCEVHTFDPTVDPDKSVQLAKPINAIFHNKGIGTELPEGGGPKASVHSLEEIIADLKHNKRERIDILKIDCESCEYTDSFLGYFKASCGDGNWLPNTTRISQVMLEFHGTSFDVIRGVFDVFDECGYRIFHKERNHWWVCESIERSFKLVDDVNSWSFRSETGAATATSASNSLLSTRRKPAACTGVRSVPRFRSWTLSRKLRDKI